MTRHFDVGVHVQSESANVPYCSDILTRSNLVELLKAAGLHVISFGTSDITAQISPEYQAVIDRSSSPIDHQESQ